MTQQVCQSSVIIPRFWILKKKISLLLPPHRCACIPTAKRLQNKLLHFYLPEIPAECKWPWRRMRGRKPARGWWRWRTRWWGWRWWRRKWARWHDVWGSGRWATACRHVTPSRWGAPLSPAERREGTWATGGSKHQRNISLQSGTQAAVWGHDKRNTFLVQGQWGPLYTCTVSVKISRLCPKGLYKQKKDRYIF